MLRGASVVSLVCSTIPGTPACPGDLLDLAGKRHNNISGDKTIKIWSLNDYSCLSLKATPTVSESHLAPVSKDRKRGERGLQVASAAVGGLVKV